MPTITHKTGYMDQRKLQSDDMSYSQQYGRWEIRAKTPTGPKTFGRWPRSGSATARSGEIDIMEAWGFDEKAAPRRSAHRHRDDHGAGADVRARATRSTTGPTPTSRAPPLPCGMNFHTYAFEFTPTYAARSRRRQAAHPSDAGHAPEPVEAGPLLGSPPARATEPARRPFGDVLGPARPEQQVVDAAAGLPVD